MYPPHSIFSVIQKLRDLLTRKDKLRWLNIIFFATASATLEIMTAVSIVIFAQVLNNPLNAMRYLKFLRINENIPQNMFIFYVSILFGITYLLKNSINLAETFYQNFSVQEMQHRFKGVLLRKFQERDYVDILQKNSSYGLGVIQNDVEIVFSIGMLSLAGIVTETITFLFLCALIFYKNFQLAFFLIAVFVGILFLFNKFFEPKFYRWGKQLQDTGLEGNKKILELINGFKEIVLIGKVPYFINKYSELSSIQKVTKIYQNSARNMPRIFIEVIYAFVFVFAVWFVGVNKGNSGDLAAILGLYLYIGFRLMPSITKIINCINNLNSSIPSIERVHSEYFIPLSERVYQDDPTFKFKKFLVLENVSFKYPNSNRDALKKINLRIKQGESLGIAGETGSGKSTLVDLILGILSPTDGTLRIDDKHSVYCKQWHQKIGYVPQSIYLIDDTIEANIALGESSSEINSKRMEKAIKESQLDEFIAQLPYGIKTQIGERGVRLSGGERQRIAIARALYRNPEVLIFDEATSALDNKTESRLMETINAIKKKRTVIMIAHRLTTLKECTQILVLRKGKIEGITNYENLPKK